jgi:hypothetical protein
VKWGFLGTCAATAAVLAVLALGAFAGIALAGGTSPLATLADTTSPTPEPPPTTTVAPTPDPGPAPAPKPASPAPRPAPAPRHVLHTTPAPVVHAAPHVAPASPPVTRTIMPTPVVKAHVRRARVPAHRVRRRTHVRRHAAPPRTPKPRVHVPPAPTLAEKAHPSAAPASISATAGAGRRGLLIVTLLAMSGLVLAAGAVPTRRLPWRVACAIEERRIELVVAGAGALAGAVLVVVSTGGL